MIRVLLVDDHALVRTGFRMILSGQPDMTVCGEAESGEQALLLVREQQPDVILMDMHLPGISGLDACIRILRQHPHCRILALTALDAMPTPRKFLEAGAAGFLTKACAADELLRAIRRVASGGKYLSPEVAQSIALDSVGVHASQCLDTLTKREMEVLISTARGENMTVMAKRMHLSIKTIASHKYNTCNKLGLTNDVELTHFAMRHGLIPTPGDVRAV